MATSIITHTETDPNGNPVDYAANFRLTTAAGQESGFRLSDGTGISSIFTSTSVAGAISVALENNSNITPGGSFYIAELLLPSTAGGTQEAAILSSSSASPQSLYNALLSAIPSYVPPTTVPPTILSGNNTFTGTNQFNGGVYFKAGDPWVDVKAYGAVGDGTTDDTVAIQAAIDALGTTTKMRGGVVYLGDGDFAISATLLVQLKACRLVGTGWRSHADPSKGTCIRWIGSAGTPMVRFRDTFGAGIDNLRLIGDASNKPTAAISIYNKTGDPNGSNYNHFRDVWIGSGFGSDTDTGIEFDNGIFWDGDNLNGDSNIFENIRIVGATTGVNMPKSQNVLNYFMGLYVSSCATGFSTQVDVLGTNWKFLSNTVTDLAIANGAHLDIQGFAGEGSAKLATVGTASQGGRLTMKYGYWQAGANMSDAAWIDNQHNTTADLNLERFDLTQNSPAFTPAINFSSPAGTASTKSIRIKGPTSIAASGITFTTAASASDVHVLVFDAGTSPFVNIMRGGSQNIDETRSDFDGVTTRFAAPTTALASIRLPHGTAPTSPVNGDMWTTSAGGLFVRINGVTVGPLS